MLMKMTKRPWRNLTGSVQAQPNHYSYPASFEEIQSEVLRAAEEGERLRVAGSGRSSSALCWTDENLMSLERYEGVERWDLEKKRIWVRSGTRMGELGEQLAQRGLALENWQGPPTQTLGGVINAGAHCSGLAFPCLSAQVLGVHFVTADGSAKTVNAEINPQLLDAARLSLGALGVITHVELQCVPAHRLHRRSVAARLEHVLPHLADHHSSNHGFSFQWFPYTGAVRLHFLNLTEQPETSHQPLHAARQKAVQSARQWLLAQAARRLPAGAAERVQRLSSREAPTPEAVVQPHEAGGLAHAFPYHWIEYGLPPNKLAAALTQMERVIRALNFSAHLPLEVRFVKRDALWLSPAHERDCAYVAVRAPLGTPYADYFTAIAEIAERHDGRPSWGGMHGKTVQELVQMYPRFNDFLRVRRELDPRGVFLNPHLAAMFGVEQK